MPTPAPPWIASPEFPDELAHELFFPTWLAKPGEVYTLSRGLQKGRVFRPRKLVIASGADAFEIFSLLMMGEEQLAAGPIPGVLFAATVTNVELVLPIMAAEAFVTITIKNVSDAPAEFRAGLLA